MQFQDTKPVAKGQRILSAEAITYNGVSLEETIPGFRTLNVSGREMLESEVNKIANVYDGDTYRTRRYPARTITVTYQLLANSPEEYREAYNQLNGVLRTDPVQIIFNDEPDKFFTGTKTEHSLPTAGSNNVTGSFKIYCPDPFKYALAEREFKADGTTLTITNTGTVPVPIRYEIEHTGHDNGYLGIASELGVMEFGKKEEADGKKVTKSESLLGDNDVFNAKDAPGTPDYMHPSYGTSGTLAVKSFHGSGGEKCLAFGTEGPEKGLCSGGIRQLSVPADSFGDKTGCLHFYLWGMALFHPFVNGQTGEMNISFLDDDNFLVAGLCWYKTDLSGNRACYELWGGGKLLKTYTYTADHTAAHNPWYSTRGCFDLTRDDDKLQFYWWGQYPTYYLPEIKGKKVTKIQLGVHARQGHASSIVSEMGLRRLNFIKTGEQGWVDTPNRYPKGSKVVIDGEKTAFYLNGMPKPQEEILGTEYFKAQPGDTTVKLNFSSFCDPIPATKAYIREAWI